MNTIVDVLFNGALAAAFLSIIGMIVFGAYGALREHWDDLAARRENHKARLEQERITRQQHIEEMEKELGM